MCEWEWEWEREGEGEGEVWRISYENQKNVIVNGPVVQTDVVPRSA